MNKPSSSTCEEERKILISIGGRKELLVRAMQNLRDLFEVCFKYGINPLPRLRKCFPEFNWEFLQLTGEKSDGEAVYRATRKVQYVWMLSGKRVVVACYKEEKMGSLFWILNEDGTELDLGSNFNRTDKIRRLVVAE